MTKYDHQRITIPLILSQQFFVPGPLPSMNEIISAANRKQAFRKRKREANARYRLRCNGVPIEKLRNSWTEKEIEVLRAAYKENSGLKGGWLIQLSAVLGKDKANVSRKARELGIRTDRNRKLPNHKIKQKTLHEVWWQSLTKEQRRVVSSERMRAFIKKNGHPRGMLGKHHTPEVCQRIAESHFGKKRPPFSDEHKQRISRNMVNRLKSMPQSLYSTPFRGKTGRREDLGGTYFRSRYEANYARFLNFQGIRWEYEKKTFWFEKIKRGVRSYTPDFYLPDSDEYHEVKGWMDKKSKTKLKRMAKYYPAIKLQVIDESFFRSITNQRLCAVIPGWECSHKNHTKK